MDIKIFKEKLFEKALQEGFTDCEIYFVKSNNFDVKIFKGEISDYKDAKLHGVSFRGTFDSNMGYAYTEKIDFDVIGLLIKNAKENAQIIEDSEKEILYKGDTDYKKINTYNEKLNEITVDTKIKDALSMETIAYNFDKRVISVDNCVIANGESEVYISNTLGLELHSHTNFCLAYLYARVIENNQTKVNGEIWIDNDYSKFDPKKLSEKAVEKSLSYLGAKQIPSGNYKTIILNEAFTDLLSCFSEIFFAINCQKGFSLLKGKLNTKIASDVLTLRDDPLKENSLIRVPFDSEGVKTFDKILVDKGILKTYLYNLKSANVDGVKSTGNGFKASYKSYVNTSCTNFYIEPSQTTLEKMANTVCDGIIITELSGLHAGINTISGDFSLSATGFLIENGKITKPVEQITIADNFYDILKNIQIVGNDLDFGMPSSSGSIGSPSVYVGELSVSGY